MGPVKLRQRIAKLAQAGRASHGEDGDVFRDGNSSQDESATNNQDHENQLLRNLPENSDKNLGASNNARKLLVPKAAARPPLGLWQRIAKQKEKNRMVQPKNIRLSRAEDNVITESVCSPCVANQITKETVSLATEVLATAAATGESVHPSTPNPNAMDNPAANAPSIQAPTMKPAAKPMRLLQNIAAKNTDKENQLRPHKKQRHFDHIAGCLGVAASKTLGACRARTPLATMSMNARCLRC